LQRRVHRKAVVDEIGELFVLAQRRQNA